MQKSKRTYLTQSDALSFARYVVSDERRLEHQQEARKKAEKAIICFTPWTMSLRTITKEDFKNWKLWRDAGFDKH